MSTVYIQPGTGTGTGTEADPYYFSQLATAETTAGSGGTILFTDGNYNSGGAANLFFTAENVTYKSLNLKGASFEYAAGSTVKILRVGYDSTGAGGTSTDGIVFSGFYVENHRLEMNTTHGTTNFATVENVHIVDTAATAHTNIGGIGRSYYNGTSGGDTFVKVRNSTFITKETASNGGVAYPDARWTFDNCSFYWSKAAGTNVNSMSRSNSIKNCIFVGDSSQTWGSSPTDILVNKSTNCCFYDLNHTSTGGTNNIFVDPQFVDLDSGDFRLRPTSPCIGAGTAS
jgi:hypothetical protein